MRYAGRCDFQGCDRPVKDGIHCAGHIRQKMLGKELTALQFRLTDEERDVVVQKLKGGAALKDVAEEHGVAPSSVSRIFRRQEGMTLSQWWARNGRTKAQSFDRATNNTRKPPGAGNVYRENNRKNEPPGPVVLEINNTQEQHSNLDSALDSLVRHMESTQDWKNHRITKDGKLLIWGEG